MTRLLHRPDRPAARLLMSAALVLGCLVLSGAAEADDTRPGDALLEQAERIVERAVDDTALTVVVTRRGEGGRPDVDSTPVATAAQAEDVVAEVLAEDEDAIVSMALPTRVASNDTYRSKQWGLDALRAETLWKTSTGAATSTRPRAVVAVVDTGVASTHPDLRGRVLAGLDVVDPGTGASDANGHGTHVAGIVAATADNRVGVAGLAPRAAILPVRVLDARGDGTSDDLARGITWAADRKVQAMNISLGYGGRDPAVSAAISYARRRGVLVVAAAGNGSKATACSPGLSSVYPAAEPGVVGVGSVNRDLRRSSFSQCGSWVDLVAPGGTIFSTMLKNNRVGGGCAGDMYCYLSGTSMAAPHVAAAGALAMVRRGRSAATVESQLQSTARDLGPRGKDSAFGAGMLDARALIAP